MKKSYSVVDEFKDGIDVVFSTEEQSRAFLQTLSFSGGRLSDLDRVLMHLPVGGGVDRGQPFATSAELRLQLNDTDRLELQQNLAEAVQRVRTEFPNLLAEFSRQFA